MRQIAFLLATTAVLALPGVAEAQHGHMRPFAPGLAPHHHGPGGHHQRREGDRWGLGWPIMMAAPPAPEGDELVTHEFIDPRGLRPRLPRVDIVSDEPVFVRQPPHIIQIHRVKQRAPITVVRRGVITQE